MATQTFTFTGGTQTFTVPTCVNTINILAIGASGGSSTSNPTSTVGHGASIQGSFTVVPGQVLTILVGGAGQAGSLGGGGGGGSFVWRGTTATMLIAAGGGGGASTNAGRDASTTTSGTAGNLGGAGGAAGSGGGAGSNAGGGGGAGVNANGGNAPGGPNGGDGGTAISAGGAGGALGTSGGAGGFGGGGGGASGAGGGGGFSGGGGGNPSGGGGGGGSFNGGTSPANTISSGTGNGSVTITWNPPAPPTIQCPPNQTVSNDPGECSADVTYSVTASSVDCEIVSISCTPPGSTHTISPPSKTATITETVTFPVGTTTMTCTATDAAGNTASCSFTVTVNDTEKPVVICPANIVTSNDPGMCGAVVTFQASATDNCTSDLNVTCDPPSGTFFQVGTTTVTCSATDGAGNTGTCSFTVTVNDTEAPIVRCPSNITVSNDPNQCGAIVTFEASATDNCTNPLVVTCNPPSGSMFPVGTTTVTCSATDLAGNTGSCSFNVTVNDTQAPIVVCPANISTTNDPGQCGAVVTFTPTVTDNCPNPTVTCEPSSGSLFPVGTTSVTCTGRDSSGNTSTCSFSVTVTDTEPPVIRCPANMTVKNDPGQLGAVVNYPDPQVTDNCGVETYSCTPPSGSFFPIGTTVVTCTATDIHGNINSCSFTVTVKRSGKLILRN